MIIDFHTHIFPKQIRLNRTKYFTCEPGFKLLYSDPKSKLLGAKELIKAMDQNNVDISVICGFPWKKLANFKMHNDYIIESSKQYPDRLKGFCCFDIFNKECVNEIQRCIKHGISGIGELAIYGSGIDDNVIKSIKPVMELCYTNKLPVLIHTNEPIGHFYPGKSPMTLGQIYNLIKQFPKNTIILAHWGGGIFFYNLLKKEVKSTLENVYFDTAASPFLYDTRIYKEAIQIAGKDKIIFGSDFPLIEPKCYFQEMKKGSLNKEEIEHICYINAANMLSIK